MGSERVDGVEELDRDEDASGGRMRRKREDVITVLILAGSAD